MSRRHTPPEKGITDANWSVDWPPEFLEELRWEAELIGILTRLQAHTSSTIKAPKVDEVVDEQVQAWLRAVKLLEGEEIIQTYDADHVIQLDIDGAPDPEGSFAVSFPLEVKVGSQDLQLGRVAAYFEDPKFLGHQEVAGRTYLGVETPNRTITWRRLTPEE